MLKKIIVLLLVSAGVMIGLPALIIAAAPALAGMMLILAEQCVIIPVFSITLGVSAGKSFKKLWFLPLASALMYLLGDLFITHAADGAANLFFYFGIYLTLGMGAAVFRHFFGKNEEKENS